MRTAKNGQAASPRQTYNNLYRLDQTDAAQALWTFVRFANRRQQVLQCMLAPLIGETKKVLGFNTDSFRRIMAQRRLCHQIGQDGQNTSQYCSLGPGSGPCHLDLH